MYMQGVAKFLVIFVQRYFYTCWNKIGTKKQNQNKNKKKTPFWRFLKNKIFYPKIWRFK